jgi:hypothetical protein
MVGIFRWIKRTLDGFDWLGRGKDAWEAMPWLWRVFWFFVGPGVIMIGSYEVALPLPGKILFFVLGVCCWSIGAYFWERRRQMLAKAKKADACPALPTDAPIGAQRQEFKEHWLDSDLADAIAESRKPGLVVPPSVLNPQQAYVHFAMDGAYSEIDSQNVSGVGMAASGIPRYYISFSAAFGSNRLTCTPVGITDREFRIISVTIDSATVEFNKTPRNVALLFKEVEL